MCRPFSRLTAKIIPRKRGEKLLNPGEITYCVMARTDTNERSRLISSSVGVAVPSGRKYNYGYLSEHHAYGETDEEAGEYTEDLAAQMLATTLGIKFDPNVAWNERKQVFKMGGDIVRTQNITQSAIGKPNLMDHGGGMCCVYSTGKPAPGERNYAPAMRNDDLRRLSSSPHFFLLPRTSPMSLK